MKERKFTYKFFKCIYKTLLMILYKPKAYGQENIPESGSIIFAGNHKHAFDPVVVMSNTKRITHFIAKEEVSKGIRKIVFNLIGVIRIYKDKTKNIASMLKVQDVSKYGGAIGIFPEGTRNRTQDELLRFKTGAVKLAKQTNSKIVPFAIRGKYRIFRKGLEIEFGEPIDISNLELQEANDYLKEKVLELLRK